METRHDEGTFAGVGGLELYWQAWLPESDPTGLILLSHGAAEHSGRYAWVAEQCTAKGYAVYAIDHRGHGRSAAPRTYVNRLDNAVVDLHTLRDLAVARHPSLPCFLLGHSMGGLIALIYALSHQEELDGLILSAPLAVIEANPAVRAASRALAAIAPRLPVYKIDGTTVSRDPEVVSAYNNDPLNYRGMLPARTIGELGQATASLPDRLPTLQLPILTVYGTGDRLADPAGSKLVHDRVSSADNTLIDYEGLYHEVLNEPERDRVIGDILDWIAAHLPDAAATGTPAELKQPQ